MLYEATSSAFSLRNKYILDISTSNTDGVQSLWYLTLKTIFIQQAAKESHKGGKL
jgi:hypothetical protein